MMPGGACSKKGNSGGGSSSSSREAQRQQALREYKDMYNSIARVVKNMIFEDASGDLGRYTGEVNGEKIPHGMGNLVYENGSVEGGKWVGCLNPLYYLHTSQEGLRHVDITRMVLGRMLGNDT